MTNNSKCKLINRFKNPVLFLPLIAMGLAIFNMTTHWTLICGLQSIGIHLGVSC